MGEDPIVTCLREAISIASDEMMVRWPGESLYAVCDERSEKQKINGAYEFLTLRRSNLAKAITFERSRTVLPLQAADFAAYEVAKRIGDPGRRRETFRRLKALEGYLPG